MKFKLFPLILLISLSAEAFDKDFKAINDRVPHDFNLLFNSLKANDLSPSEKLKLIALAKDLNQNLGFLPKAQMFMLMKSEVIKNVLEKKFKNVRQLNVNNQLIQNLEEEFKAKKPKLNNFSQWIWQGVLAELKHRQSMGLITAAPFSPTQFEGQKLVEAQRFNRYLNYLLPWIDQMLILGPEEFNQLSKEVSWDILNRLNERSLLFKRYASSAAGDTQTTIFNIPQKLLNLHPEDIKKMQNDELPLSLKDLSKKEKSEASSEIEKVTPMDLSPLSDDVAKELESKEVD